MRVGELWRLRYEDVLRENEKLKDKNKKLTNQLVATIGVILIMFIYEIIKK